MRTFLLTAICALLFGASTLSAQEKPDKYIINGQVIENFNGAQLEGLKVESYKIETSTEEGKTVKTHVITTSGDASSSKYAEPVYVVDGEAVTKEDFEKVNVFDIERIDVIKGNSEDETIKRYLAEGKGVVKITLKKTKSKEYKAVGETMKLRNANEDSYKVTVRGSSK